MKSSLSCQSFCAALFFGLFFCGVAIEQVEAQKLSGLIANQDLDAIRAAVAKEPALLTKQDSRTKQTPLFAAIQAGHAPVVDVLLELGAPTNELDRRKQTPLQFALTRGRPEITKSILGKTQDVDQRGGRQNATSLMYVIMYRNGDAQLLDAILKKGANVNLKNSNKQTALHIACYYNNIAAAKALIAAGADLDSQDNNFNTPLLAACMISPALVSEMLSNGADPLIKNRQGQSSLHLVCQAGRPQSTWDSEIGNKTFAQLLSRFDKVDLVDKQKLTPLALAVFSQNPKFVKSLIDRGADPKTPIDGQRLGNRNRNGALVSVAASQGDAGSVKALVNGGAEVNIVNDLGETPLHSVAAAGGNSFGMHNDQALKRFADTVSALLDAKANPNAKNKEGQTPLALAASQDFFSAVELLVDHTDELDLKLAEGSLLHWAAKNGLARTGKRLLAKPEGLAAVDADAVNSIGQTALQVAAENGKSKLVELLIANQANLDHVDNEGSTALLLAAAAGQAEVVTVLVKAGADTTKVDSSGHSALHLAAWGGDAKVINVLMSRMKVGDSITESGYTPLHAAAWNGHEAAVVALLKGGADPNVADSDGWTPLHKAAYRGHAKAVQALIDNGADKSLKNGVEMTASELAKSNGKAGEIESLLK